MDIQVMSMMRKDFVASNLRSQLYRLQNVLDNIEEEKKVECVFAGACRRYNFSEPDALSCKERKIKNKGKRYKKTYFMGFDSPDFNDFNFRMQRV